MYTASEPIYLKLLHLPDFVAKWIIMERLGLARRSRFIGYTNAPNLANALCSTYFSAYEIVVLLNYDLIGDLLLVNYFIINILKL